MKEEEVKQKQKKGTQRNQVTSDALNFVVNTVRTLDYLIIAQY